MITWEERRNLYSYLSSIPLGEEHIQQLEEHFNPKTIDHLEYSITPSSVLEGLLADLLLTFEREPGKTKILDLGCGSGLPTAVFASANFQAYGVDIDLSMLQIASQRFGRVPSILGRRLLHRPKFHYGDYLDRDFPNMNLGDRVTPQDIDVFWYRNYSDQNLLNLWQSLTYAKPGAIFLQAYNPLPQEIAQQSGFSPISSSSFPYHLMKKTQKR